MWPMNAQTPVCDLRVAELLARIGSSTVSPGAGAAGAVALALAAACASKAASISLRHRPDDPELQAAFHTFQRIARTALAAADRDSEAFEAFIHEKKPDAADRLIAEEQVFGHLIATLTAAIDVVAPRIQPNMRGDVAAARALAVAAHRIQQRNEGEALDSR